MRKKWDPLDFTSHMTRGETIAALTYLPVHVAALPIILNLIMLQGWIGEATANFLCYAVGVVYMLCFEWKFLRREFDPLCDGIMRCVLQICICYGLMLICNLCVNGALLMLLPDENPNNVALVDMAGAEYGKIFAMAVFLAPLVEELIFRAGIFGAIRQRSRLLAYVVSMLAFSVYHIWGYAVSDPIYWLYIVQYIPVSYLLCRCYERSNSIWSSIFLHMVINGISLKALMAAQGLM